MNIIKRLYRRLSNQLKYSKIMGGGNIRSEKADIEKSRNSTFVVEGGLLVRKGTLIASRENGCIVFKGNTFINRNCYIVSYNSIKFGKNISIGPSTCIVDHNHNLDGSYKVVTAPINIGDNVWIGANCSILMGGKYWP